ncbi:hypothetical protein SAMN06265795_103217 [Noviherbaspirillum humi]|uniref:Uncharacterized protein n=1 Tax=Noviherbaspirillum humi TaxID=1688639 RepID=A0A239F7H8_9BURK|nr:hypothetical protein [Noviherbaspirillum humi]SNS52711.1 hypothetical protein SAMN06265795_103217 [Noviherbaspirillum humi]
MHFTRCGNSDCHRPFQVNSFVVGPDMAGRTGRICCPHCGFAMAADHGVMFLSHPLSAEEEADFERAHPADASLHPSLAYPPSMREFRVAGVR